MGLFTQKNNGQEQGKVAGRFGGIENSSWTNRGIYFLPRSPELPAHYVVEIGEIKAGKTMGGVGNFIVEAKILESDHAERPAGTKCSWYVGLDKMPALGNIRQFCAEAGDCDFEDVDEAAVELIVSGGQPLKGVIVRLEVMNAPTKAGRPFSRHTWMRVPEADQKKYQTA